MVSVTRGEIVGVAPARIVSYDESRTGLIIQNTHNTNILYLGTDNSITALTGIRVPPGATFRLSSAPTGPASYEFYALASGANTTVAIGDFVGVAGEATDMGVDTGADVQIDSEGTIGAATPTTGILVAGTDGVNLQPLKVEDSTNPNLRVRLYDGLNPTKQQEINADAILTTTRVLSTASYKYGFNGATWDRLRSEQTGIQQTINMGAAVVGTIPDVAVGVGIVALAANACKKVLIQNQGPGVVRIGDAGITATQGARLVNRAAITFEVDNTSLLHHRTEAGVSTIAVSYIN